MWGFGRRGEFADRSASGTSRGWGLGSRARARFMDFLQGKLFPGPILCMFSVIKYCWGLLESCHPDVFSLFPGVSCLSISLFYF